MFFLTLPSVLGHSTRKSRILGAWELPSVQARTLGKPDDFAECLGQDTRQTGYFAECLIQDTRQTWYFA